MKKKISDSEIARYVSGASTPEERRHIEEALREGKGSMERLRLAEEIWKRAGIKNIPGFDANAALEKVNNEIISGRVTDEGTRALGRQIVMSSLRIAAMVVVVLGIYWIIQQRKTGNSTEMIVIETGIHEKTDCFLPDSTHVFLNSSSRIEYPVRFAGHTRDVNFEGEAYFKVAKDARHPFIIHTPSSVTKVLGTAFNLRALKEEAEITVTVEEGRVSLTAVTSASTYKVILVAGFSGTLEKKTNKLSSRVNKDPNFLAWKTGKLVFRNNSLREVTAILQQFYHQPVQLADSSIANLPVDYTISNVSLGKAVQTIAITFDLKADSTASGFLFKKK